MFRQRSQYAVGLIVLVIAFVVIQSSRRNLHAALAAQGSGEKQDPSKSRPATAPADHASPEFADWAKFSPDSATITLETPDPPEGRIFHQHTLRMVNPGHNAVCVQNLAIVLSENHITYASVDRVFLNDEAIDATTSLKKALGTAAPALSPVGLRSIGQAVSWRHNSGNQPYTYIWSDDVPGGYIKRFVREDINGRKVIEDLIGLRIKHEDGTEASEMADSTVMFDSTATEDLRKGYQACIEMFLKSWSSASLIQFRSIWTETDPATQRDGPSMTVEITLKEPLVIQVRDTGEVDSQDGIDRRMVLQIGAKAARTQSPGDGGQWRDQELEDNLVWTITAERCRGKWTAVDSAPSRFLVGAREPRFSRPAETNPFGRLTLQ